MSGLAGGPHDAGPSASPLGLGGLNAGGGGGLAGLGAPGASGGLPPPGQNKGVGLAGLANSADIDSPLGGDPNAQRKQFGQRTVAMMIQSAVQQAKKTGPGAPSGPGAPELGHAPPRLPRPPAAGTGLAPGQASSGLRLWLMIFGLFVTFAVCSVMVMLALYWLHQSGVI